MQAILLTALILISCPLFDGLLILVSTALGRLGGEGRVSIS
jgi:hypothetical protein